jgi:sigma-B regulation protein RsbU (phosphoserine phosphatase)
VAGDFYDVFELPGERLGLVIADVADKGMPAALFMALTRSIVRASLDASVSPSDGITRANRLICADSTHGMFVTLFYALLDPASREITFANAGHNPPLLCRAEERVLTRLTLTGIPLGIEADVSFAQRSMQLYPGDVILFYTDGVTDATNTGRQLFGMERLERVLLDHHRMPAKGVMAALEAAMDDFAGPAAPFDDIAIVVLKCLE